MCACACACRLWGAACACSPDPFSYLPLPHTSPSPAPPPLQELGLGAACESPLCIQAPLASSERWSRSPPVWVGRGGCFPLRRLTPEPPAQDIPLSPSTRVRGFVNQKLQWGGAPCKSWLRKGRRGQPGCAWVPWRLPSHYRASSQSVQWLPRGGDSPSLGKWGGLVSRGPRRRQGRVSHGARGRGRSGFSTTASARPPRAPLLLRRRRRAPEGPHRAGAARLQGRPRSAAGGSDWPRHRSPSEDGKAFPAAFNGEPFSAALKEPSELAQFCPRAWERGAVAPPGRPPLALRRRREGSAPQAPRKTVEPRLPSLVFPGGRGRLKRAPRRRLPRLSVLAAVGLI